MTEKKDMVEQILDKANPLLANLSFGAIMGYSSGYALKKVGKALAFIIGIGFISLQTAISYGYIEGINWTKVRDDAAKQMDTNKDGTVDTKDVKEYWKILKKVLTYKLPAAGGFSLGFVWGVRYG